MSKKIIDVTSKYNRELVDIKNKLQQLENMRIYDRTNAKMDGYLVTNVKQLSKMISDLIYKIEYGINSIDDELIEIFDKLDDEL